VCGEEDKDDGGRFLQLLLQTSAVASTSSAVASTLSKSVAMPFKAIWMG